MQPLSKSTSVKLHPTACESVYHNYDSRVGSDSLVHSPFRLPRSLLISSVHRCLSGHMGPLPSSHLQAGKYKQLNAVKLNSSVIDVCVGYSEGTKEAMVN